MPEIGDIAPDFSLPRDGGGSLTLSGLRGSAVVLYFYPRDDTPGCTRESIEFSDRLQEFADAGARVIGISRDSVARHDRFVARHGLKVALASDGDGAVCAAYGVWVEKKNYGRTHMGIERATFVIGADGRIVRVWRKVRVAGHVGAVLGALRG